MIAALFALALAGAGYAPATVPIARQTNPLRCGAVERPGIVERAEDGAWRGVAVDLCRRLAQAERGPQADFVFHVYRTSKDLRAAAEDSLAVLSLEHRAKKWEPIFRK